MTSKREYTYRYTLFSLSLFFLIRHRLSVFLICKVHYFSTGTNSKSPSPLSPSPCFLFTSFCAVLWLNTILKLRDIPFIPSIKSFTITNKPPIPNQSQHNTHGTDQILDFLQLRVCQRAHLRSLDLQVFCLTIFDANKKHSMLSLYHIKRTSKSPVTEG